MVVLTTASNRFGRGGSRSASSVPPEVLEAIWREGSVAHGRGNRPMPQVILDCARVVAIVGELEAAGMAQHVRNTANKRLQNPLTKAPVLPSAGVC